MSPKDEYLKVCLLGASFSTGNMGVGALAAGAIKCLKYQFPKADIFLLDYGKEEVTYNLKVLNRDILVQLLNLRFSKKLFLRNNIAILLAIAFLASLIPSEDTRRRLISRNYYLSRISEADIVASIAGGDSFSDIYGLGRFFYVALPQLLAILTGKKLILLPQTLGPFKSKLAEAVARFIMSRSSAIYSRDHEGIREAERLLGSGASDRIKFCYDVGFALDPVKPDGLELPGLLSGKKSSLAVGLNVSGLLYMGGYTGRNMFGLKTGYRELIHSLIDFLINKKGADVVLIPHVFSGGEPESDLDACEGIYNELGSAYGERLFVVRGEYDQHGIKHIIGLCDFFIGSRMHACIAAISQNIPSVAIAYSEKFMGVMDSIGLADIVADPRSMECGEILDHIDKHLNKRDEIKRRLQARMPGVKECVLNLFKGLPLS